MKAAIIGSRTLNIRIDDYLPDGITLIVSGGAKGIDQLAEQFADKNGIDKLVFLPDYSKFGSYAPFARNIQIVDSADMVVAFWDGRSRGTMHTVNYARQTGKQIMLHKIL